MDKDAYRKKITMLLLSTYLPKMKKNLMNFMDTAVQKEMLAMECAKLTGRPIEIDVGFLKLADPTNELIDNLVTIWEEEKNKKTVDIAQE